MAKPKFNLGSVVITPGADEFCKKNEVNVAQILGRHSTGDWGDLVPGDANRRQHG